MNKPFQSAIAVSLCAGSIMAHAATADCGLDVNPVVLDTNHNAELSRRETWGSPLADVFDRVDTNQDGVISQSEFVSRCASLQASRNAGWGTDWQDSAAGKAVTNKVQRQNQRQSYRINNRVNQETDKAADNLVDKAMGAFFGH